MSDELESIGSYVEMIASEIMEMRSALKRLLRIELERFKFEAGVLPTSAAKEFIENMEREIES